MFIGIRFLISLTSICIFANLNSVQMFGGFWGLWKKEKLIPIEKPHLTYFDDRNDKEAEVSLLTKSLGFIVCDQQLPPFMENFLYHYTSMKKSHTLKLEHIKKKHFREASVDGKRELCQRYLNDPVLRENKIFLTDDPSWLEKIQVEKREIHFDYYAREPAIVKAIACPVCVRNRIRTLYIAGIGTEENAAKEQYFILAERSPNESSKLSILMRTVVGSDPNENSKLSDLMRTIVGSHQEKDEHETVDDAPELIVENSNRCDIQLTIKDYWYLDEIRLFGKEAERAYITTLYGFINLNYDQRLVDRFVELVEDLKKVYRVESAITKHSIKDMPNNEKLQLCSRYVRESVLLSTLPIYPITNEEELQHKIKVKDVEIEYQQLRTPSETHKFLKCPVVYVTKYGEREQIKLYVMPVAFEVESRCGRFSFLKLHVPTDGETWAHDLLLYSKQEGPKIFWDMNYDAVGEGEGEAEHSDNTGMIAGAAAGAGLATVVEASDALEGNTENEDDFDFTA